ncbi:MAG: hypothetical protein JJU11_01410 [Candidatus Sumerlaeia bacterium]|nr:hypothetical protein [Candidatus Sumerlaeia bacterium]
MAGKFLKLFGIGRDEDREKKPVKMTSRNVMGDFSSTLEGPEYSRDSEPGGFRAPEPVIIRQSKQSGWAAMAPIMEHDDVNLETEQDPVQSPRMEADPFPAEKDPPTEELKKSEKSWDILDWGDE